MATNDERINRGANAPDFDAAVQTTMMFFERIRMMAETGPAASQATA
jgi:hypothetical protein